MSLFHGLLLFDVPDKPIGQWKENLGYRGVKDVWEIKEKGLMLIVENSENPDNEKEQEVWVCDEEIWETIGWYNTYEEAIKEAKIWMLEHPNGW